MHYQIRGVPSLYFFKNGEVIDQIVDEPLGGAHRHHKWAAIKLKKALRSQLKELMALKPSELVEQRQEKFRNIGVFNTEKE